MELRNIPILEQCSVEMEELKYQISKRFKKANSIYYQRCNTFVEKRVVDNHVKFHVFKVIYLPILLCGSESCGPVDRHWNRVTAANEVPQERGWKDKVKERVQRDLEIAFLKD